MAQKRNTRQIILNEAFNLCYESPKSIFSLSELAERVGISKTAIFRHFKNKDALLFEMGSLIADGLAEIMRKGDYFREAETHLTENYERFSDLINSLVKFFQGNKGYLGFALNTRTFMPSPGQSLLKGLMERGVYISPEFLANKTPQRFFRVYFCGETLIYFLSRRDYLTQAGISEYNSEEGFIKKITDLLWKGIARSKPQLDSKRIAELDKLCELSFKDKPEDTRFFTAFAETFQENGFDGLTVERISDKLNLAKSSLYAFFENKEEFVQKMLVEEFSVIMKVIVEKTMYAETLEELAYVLLRCEKNYLEKRPFVLMIHYWASQRGLNIYRFKDDQIGYNERFEYLKEKNIQMPELFNYQSFVGWESSLVGALKFFFDMTPLRELECIIDYAQELYKLIINGIENQNLYS